MQHPTLKQEQSISDTESLVSITKKMKFGWPDIVKGLIATIIFLSGLWFQSFLMNRSYESRIIALDQKAIAIRDDFRQHEEQNLATRKENNDAHIMIMGQLTGMERKIDSTLENQKKILAHE